MSIDTLERLMVARSEWNLPRGHLSPSQVWSMVSCGECYRRKYVENTPEPPSENLAIGKAAHAAVQRQREYLMDGIYDQRPAHLRMPAFLDAASDSYDQSVKDADEVEPQECWPPDVTRDLRPFKDEAIRIARFAVESLLPVDRLVRIVAIEQRVYGLGTPSDAAEEALMREVGLEPIFPFPFKAITDLVAETADERILKADLKTSGNRRAPEWWPRTQLTLYSLPDWCNGFETLLRFDQVVKNERPIFQQHWMEKPTDEWRQQVIQMVLDAAEDISAGRFRMRPSYACTFSHRLPGLSVAVDGFA